MFVSVFAIDPNILVCIKSSPKNPAQLNPPPRAAKTSLDWKPTTYQFLDHTQNWRVIRDKKFAEYTCSAALISQEWRPGPNKTILLRSSLTGMQKGDSPPGAILAFEIGKELELNKTLMTTWCQPLLASHLLTPCYLAADQKTKLPSAELRQAQPCVWSLGSGHSHSYSWLGFRSQR